MLKIFGMLLIISSAGLFGFYKSFVLKKNIDFLREYISFINQTKDLISYSRANLIYVFENVNVNNDFKKILTRTLKHLQAENSFLASWEKSLKENKVPTKYAVMLESFAQTLGTTDVDGQISHCNLSRAIAEKALSEAEECYKTKGGLYRKLGILSGIAISVIII